MTKLPIEFMYIDLMTCDRCLGTGDAVEEAIDAVLPALTVLSYEPQVDRVLVESADQARDLRFVSSPTIRVGGIDISGELKESNCGACSDVCGEDTDCRVWHWRGDDYTSAPAGMIVEALMASVVTSPTPTLRPQALPENLVRFFDAKSVTSQGCCAPQSCSCA